MTTIESILHLATSWALFTLIWMTQLISYPSFKYIDPNQFQSYHLSYTSSITIIVMPLMLIELGLCVWLAYKFQLQQWHWLPLFLVGILWASTFFIQVPLHEQLGKGYDNAAIDRLVQTNWIRTVFWTVKAGIVSWMISRYL